MPRKEFIVNWQGTLFDIFAGYVNQETLEAGAAQMVFVSCDNPAYHRTFLEAIDRGLEQIGSDAARVIEIVNASGYRVATAKEAADLLVELRRCYLEEFERSSGARGESTD